MASPQTAHGYTKVANSIMRALCRFHFSGQELRLLVWVLRDSYGWGEKSTHAAPLSRISEETLIPRATASWAIRKLVDRAVLIRNKNRTLRFNKNYDEWMASAPDMLPLLGRSTVRPEPTPEPAPKRGAAFVPPTIEHVAAYCRERKNAVDPDKFWHHYESRGWMSGKTKMTNWKSSVCYWERTERDGAAKAKPTGKLCQLCEENALPNPNAVVCDRCGPQCRACGEQTAVLKIVVRRDKTKTAQCRNGCSSEARPSANGGVHKIDAAATARFLAEQTRRKGR